MQIYNQTLAAYSTYNESKSTTVEYLSLSAYYVCRLLISASQNVQLYALQEYLFIPENVINAKTVADFDYQLSTVYRKVVRIFTEFSVTTEKV